MREDETGQNFVLSIHPALNGILKGLPESELKDSLKRRLQSFIARTFLQSPADLEQALAPHLWVLREANMRGLDLTPAGYIRPAEVKALAGLLPEMRQWTFPIEREVNTPPVLFFRHYLKDIGLLRKYKNSLKVSRLGKTLASDPDLLWAELARTLVLDTSEFEATVTALILLYVGSEQTLKCSRDEILDILLARGWRDGRGVPVDLFDLWDSFDWVETALNSIGENSPSLTLNAQLLVRDALFAVSVDDSGEWG